MPVTMTYSAGISKGKKYPLDLYHTLKFYIKDGKTKIVFTDLSTVSKDFASQFINATDPKPIETEDTDVQKMKGKKRERYNQYAELWAREIDLHIQLFLASLGKDLQKQKSAFDF